MGISSSSLHSKSLELTGETPVEFIRFVKLEKAALLIEKSSMNITQIGYDVRFYPDYREQSCKEISAIVICPIEVELARIEE